MIKKEELGIEYKVHNIIKQFLRKRALDFARNIPKPRRYEKAIDQVTPRNVDNQEDFD